MGKRRIADHHIGAMDGSRLIFDSHRATGFHEDPPHAVFQEQPSALERVTPATASETRLHPAHGVEQASTPHLLPAVGVAQVHDVVEHLGQDRRAQLASAELPSQSRSWPFFKPKRIMSGFFDHGPDAEGELVQEGHLLGRPGRSASHHPVHHAAVDLEEGIHLPATPGNAARKSSTREASRNRVVSVHR